MNVLMDYDVGDYVYYKYSKSQEYPGVVTAIEGPKIDVEISTNKKKSEGIEIMPVVCDATKLRHIRGL